MFSACQDVSIMPTWDGYFFISGDKSYNGGQSYILSGYSGEKSAYTPPDDARIPPRFYTHQFVYISYPVLRDRSPEIHHIDGWYIVLEQIPDPLPPPFLSDGQINPEMTALFAESSKIFLHPGQSNPFIVAINYNTEAASRYGFILSRARFPDLETEWVEQFLQESNLPYVRIVPTADRYISPNGRFLAENDGIYDVATGQQVTTIPFVDQEPFSTPFSTNYRPCCWFPDSSAVIYQFEPPAGGSFYEVSLIEWLDRIAFGAPIHMDTFSLPVLKVHKSERES